jgi:transposase
MQTQGTARDKEHRRRLAVERVKEGWNTSEVADFLAVSIRSVQRWVKAEREGGPAALAAKPYPGHPKLTPQQAAIVIEWLRHNPREFDFGTELWTAKRVAFLIKKRFGVDFHPHYVNAWLARRMITPQKPERVPRERNPQKIDEWLAEEWPRIQTKKAKREPIWCSLTKADS